MTVLHDEAIYKQLVIFFWCWWNDSTLLCYHYDVIKWKHFLHYCPFVQGSHWWFHSQRDSDVDLWCFFVHYSDVIMGTIASQITSLTIVYSTVYSDADQRKHQSFASLAFVWGIHRGPVNSPHKWPVTRKMFPFDDVIMCWHERTVEKTLDWLVIPDAMSVISLQSNDNLSQKALNMGLVVKLSQCIYIKIGHQ